MNTMELERHARADRVYTLLPRVIRESDLTAGRPLQALLRVMAEQANIVEDDIAGLLENWFVETCDDWVLPYIGELVGYRLVSENTLPSPDDSARGRDRTRALVPRREVANTIRFRRRKGALLLLEEIAVAATGWPARAVEFRTLIASMWHTRFPKLGSGRTLTLRDLDWIDRGYGAFDGLSRLVDMRRIGSHRTPGRGGVSSVGLWVWRLKAHEVREGECRFVAMADVDTDHLGKFTIHPAGIDQPLFVRPTPLPKQTEPASERELPGPLRPQAIRKHPEWYYGNNQSLQLGWSCAGGAIEWLPLTAVEVADLANWENSLQEGDPLLDEADRAIDAAVDVRRGRLLFRRKHHEHATIVWARHHVGLSADIGGGGYFRPVRARQNWNHHWYVRKPNSPDDRPAGGGVFGRLGDALKAWRELHAQQPGRAWRVLIEIEDDSIQKLGAVVGNPAIVTELGEGDYLEIRAVSHCRAVIRPADLENVGVWRVKQNRPRDTDEASGPGGTFILDGVMLTDMTLSIEGRLQEVALRHCTVFAAEVGREKALEVEPATECLSIEKSIVVGSIHVGPKRQPTGHTRATQVPATPELYLPIRLHVIDSILDGDECDENAAVTGIKHGHQHGHPTAYAEMRVLRSTVFGNVLVHTLDLAEDSLFVGHIRVDNTSRGCMRFCSISAGDALAEISPTPPRYECQPDLELARLQHSHLERSAADGNTSAQSVAPRFTSIRYGDPGYSQLATDCPEAIRRGASDESEMGAFHDLYNAQRESLLRARLAEYTPAGADVQLLWAT